MADADQQSALEILKTANMKPRIDAGTGQLSVPAGKYHEARILLASQGVPKQQTRGVLDSLKDQSAMTTSQFMEQARYSAAIEQELQWWSRHLMAVSLRPRKSRPLCIWWPRACRTCPLMMCRWWIT
jgi:flagellar biosynthesis/type III secretory pathway M-ring protein FliF/YscJ